MTDSTLNAFLARGTQAQRIAFTPSPPTPASGPSPGYSWFETDTGDSYAYSGSGWVRLRDAARWKDPVRAGTTGTLAANTYNNGTSGVGATLTGNANGTLAAQDGVTLAAGDRLLVKNESAGANNGIYTVTQLGSAGTPYILTRATDADSGTELVNAVVKISEGSTLADTEYQCTTNATITVGSTSLTFAAAGGGTSFTAASTTDQLTGTDTAKGATSDSVAALWEQGADVASAATVSLGEGGYFNITGTTTITDIDFATDKAGRTAWVKFAGALTLTHNASTLILPTSANITTAAGDTACFISEGSDVVRCVSYNRASGSALASVYRLASSTGGLASTATTSEEFLYTYTVPAGTLASDGQCLRITLAGTMAAVSRSRVVKIYIGATSSTVASSATSTVVQFRSEHLVTRTGATSQRISGLSAAGPNNAVTVNPFLPNFTAAETLSGAFDIKFSSTVAAGASANDVVINQVLIEMIP